MVATLARLSHDIPVLGPIGIGIATLGTAAMTPVLGADPMRRGVIFHNPGANILRVTPGNIVALGLAGAAIIYPQSELSIFADDLTNVNCAWNAWVDNGANQPITVLNFTDNNPAVTNPPEALAQLNTGTPITSPLGYPLTLGTVSAAAIGANPVRRRIDFHNPGTGLIAFSPANLAASIGAGSIVVLPGQTKTIQAQGRVRVNCGWNAIAQNAASPATILEYL